MRNSEDTLIECTSNNFEINLKEINNALKSILVEENDIQRKNLSYLQNYAKIIHQWKNKIENNIHLLDEEIIYQLERRNYLRKATVTLKQVSRINEECIWYRSTKLDGDYHDEVEKELEKEKVLIEEVNSQLKLGLEQLQEFLEKMKAAKLNLELIWSNKIENYNVECDNINLNQLSKNTLLKYGATRIFNTDITRKEWERNIENNMNYIKELLCQSYDTHVIINDHILAANQRKLREQAQIIDIILMKKKHNTENNIRKLENELQEVINKQCKIKNTIENINNEIKFLENSLKLTETRLSNRLQKPLQEQFFDEIQNGLLQEDEIIKNQKFFLENKILNLEEILKHIFSQRIKIENELQLKLNSFWIDGNQCPKIRIHYPSATSLSGY
ncbi:hypothetical protein PGB90_007802 [Kerria lacca]